MTKDSALNKRIVTALVGIPLVLLIVWQGSWLLLGVTILLAILALRELQVATTASETPMVAWIAYPALLAFLLSPLRETTNSWLLPSLILFVLLSFGVLQYPSPRRISLNSIALTLLSVFYVGLFAFLPLLRDVPGFGLGLMWLVLLGVWTGDSAAYFIGRAWGRRKLTPLSPGKTWEGVIAGIVATILVCILIGNRINLGFAHSAILGLIIGCAAPLGDLVESFWKRELGVKDMGTLLPGHGGVLDRCDSLLFATAAAYIYVGS